VGLSVFVCELQSEPQHSAPRRAHWDEDADDGKWSDEDVGIEGVADDLLRLEFHTGDAENCRHMWELRREALLPVVSSPTTSLCNVLILLYRSSVYSIAR
jgi:hypothetical protein